MITGIHNRDKNNSIFFSISTVTKIIRYFYVVGFNTKIYEKNRTLCPSIVRLTEKILYNCITLMNYKRNSLIIQ